MVCIRYDGQHSRGQRRFPISPRFALHQDELNVVLYDGIGFIRFPQKTGSVAGGLKRGIGNLVPDNRRQIVITNLSTVVLNRGVKWNDRVSPVIFPS